MSLDVSSAEPLAWIAGYRATALLSRQPPEGDAYKAVAEGGRRVDLWVVPARDPEFATRFLDQAGALAELEHDNLPRILDAGEADEGLYLATEPAEGASLQELIEESPGISPMRAVRLLGEAADALDAAHAVEVLHVWLSPSCVVVAERPLERAVLHGFALGAAPKGRQGQADDVQAFARVMFECFTSAPPRDGTRASEIRPGLPTALDEVLARGMSGQPADRPPTAAKLVAEAAKAVIALSPTAMPSRAAPVEPLPAPEPAAAPEPTAAPEPEPAPAPKKDRVPLRSRLAGATVPFALAAVVVAAAAVGGWVVGKPESGASAPDSVTSGVVELSMPSGWRATRPPRRLGDLTLSDAVSASGASNGRMDAGVVPGTLPARVVDRVARRPGSPDAVRLGDLQAYVWRDLAERGSGSRITLFASGTDTGLVALACRGAASARARCERTASSLAVPGGLPVELGEIDTWTRRLDRVMADLASRRQTGRTKLRAARTPRGLAAAARRLGKTYSTASRSLTGHRAPTGAGRAQREINSSLRDVAAAYKRLAAAARRQRGARYRAARRSISRGERSLKRSLQRL